MRTPEGRLWQRMKTGIELLCFSQRVENLVGEGLPDVVLHCRKNGREAWTELKCRPEMPSRPTTPIFKGDYGLRPEQVAWIYGRACAGAGIFILGQGGERLWLVHGSHARELSEMNAVQLSKVCDWEGAARRTDWQSLTQKLFEERKQNGNC